MNGGGAHGAGGSASEGVWAAHAALVGVQLCFGLFPVFGKEAFAGFAPAAVAGWRIGVAAAVFVVLAVLRHRRAALVLVADLPRIQLCSLLGIALNQVLYLEGLARSTAVHAGVIMLAIPAFTFAVAVLARQEPLRARRAAGIAVAAGGAALLVAEKGDPGAAAAVDGDLLMVGNCLCYSIYLVASRPLLRRYPPLVVMAWMFLASTWTVPWVVGDAELVPAAATPRAWLALVAILLLPTCGGYLLNLYALARVPASTVAVYVLAQPLLAGLGGVLWLGEPLRAMTVVAAGAIAVGIQLVARRRRPATQSRHASRARL